MINKDTQMKAVENQKGNFTAADFAEKLWAQQFLEHIQRVEERLQVRKGSGNKQEWANIAGIRSAHKEPVSFGPRGVAERGSYWARRVPPRLHEQYHRKEEKLCSNIRGAK